jgi:hypothetical protein
MSSTSLAEPPMRRSRSFVGLDWLVQISIHVGAGLHQSQGSLMTHVCRMSRVSASPDEAYSSCLKGYSATVDVL